MMNDEMKSLLPFISSFIIHHSSFLRGMPLTICPCCGVSSEGGFGDGCASCGARAVGPPLARPERVLPGYGHALAISAAGLLMACALAGSTAGALLQFDEF